MPLTKGDEGIQKIATRFGVGTGTVECIKAEDGAELTPRPSGAL